MPMGTKQRQPLSRRRVIGGEAASALRATGRSRRIVGFLGGQAVRKATLAVAAIQAGIISPDRGDPVAARARNLETALSLLEKVQSCGGHKDICLFPVLPLPGDAVVELLRAARRYNCTLVYGTEGLARSGGILRLTTTVPPNGDVRVVHADMESASTLVLRTRNGVYRAVACAADAWYPGQAGLITAIHSPDGRQIVATGSRGEQVIAAVLHIGDSAAHPVPS